MKHTYVVMMNKTGKDGRFGAEVTMTITAESETNAIIEAKKRHPGLQVCFIEQKN